MKNSEYHSDIKMGSLDSEESSNLVGLSILYNLSEHREIDIKDIRLNKDVDLMVVKTSNNIKIDKIRKVMHR